MGVGGEHEYVKHLIGEALRKKKSHARRGSR